MNEQTAAYSEAVDYACKVLGNDAPKYFFRLHQLSQHNSKEELESIIDSWYHATLPKPPRQVAPGLWTPGSQWGTAGAVRVEHITGIMWKIRCACGVIFECSTNDTIPEYQRACPKCRLIDEMSRTRKKINAILDENAQTVLEWYESHDNVVWKRVHRACLTRSIDDYRFKQELHALVWLHISENAGKYRDKGVKASAWIGRVASNIVADYFKTQYNRQELVPTFPLAPGEDAAAPATRPEEVLPAKAVRPEGADPCDGAMNQRQAAWDAGQQDDSKPEEDTTSELNALEAYSLSKV